MGVRAATIPAPRGAGMSRTVTLPHLPVTLEGTVCTCGGGGWGAGDGMGLGEAAGHSGHGAQAAGVRGAPLLGVRAGCCHRHVLGWRLPLSHLPAAHRPPPPPLQ